MHCRLQPGKGEAEQGGQEQQQWLGFQQHLHQLQQEGKEGCSYLKAPAQEIPSVQALCPGQWQGRQQREQRRWRCKPRETSALHLGRRVSVQHSSQLSADRGGQVCQRTAQGAEWQRQVWQGRQQQQDHAVRLR